MWGVSWCKDLLVCQNGMDCIWTDATLIAFLSWYLRLPISSSSLRACRRPWMLVCYIVICGGSTNNVYTCSHWQIHTHFIYWKSMCQALHVNEFVTYLSLSILKMVLFLQLPNRLKVPIPRKVFVFSFNVRRRKLKMIKAFAWVIAESQIHATHS